MINWIYLTVALPMIGFLINGLLGSKIKNEKVIGIIGSSAVGIPFLISVVALFELLALPNDQRVFNVPLFTWLSSGWLNVSFAYRVDQLSIVMALVVTGVGFIIHIYSIGYMHGDKGFWRFFAYLNLFIFAMMNLILADNFLLLFLGWEGVGLCSYLLIGFWYDRKFEKSTTSDAAKKAFIVNRIGDFGFLLGMFLIYITFNSLNFAEVFSRAAALSIPTYVFEFIAIFLFIGATVITKKIKTCPAESPRKEAKVTKVRLAEFSISSIDIKRTIALRRIKTPITPVVNIKALRTR